MKKVSLTKIKRIYSAIKKDEKRKYLSLDDLSRQMGIYSDVLCDDLEEFEPMIRMDSSLNMKDLLTPLSTYIEKETEKNAANPNKPIKITVTKKEIRQYPHIADFVYAKFTGMGGLVDTSAELSDHDLHLLRKLVEEEISSRKKKKRALKKAQKNR